VVDATSKSLLNRILTAGETVTLNGTPPLSVIIGRKDVVTATVRGQPFDLTAVSKTNVARFQVK
jgi:cytoskeleton protein RodZ